MDRELVFIALALLLFGALTCLGALVARVRRPDADLSRHGAEIERGAAWWLLAPVAPGLISLSALVGWALVEPEDAERPPWVVFALGVPVLLVCLRAAARAVMALRPRIIQTAATLGIWRPRVVLNPDFALGLDNLQREAVMAHELAHVRHRDPLRVWVAQIVTDLQWPMPGAWARFEAWRAVLELARDDEAREKAAGEDLAVAVLAAARRGCVLEVVGIASTPAARLRTRVDRLLAPVPARQAGHRFPVGLTLAGAIAMALFAGSLFGEGVVFGLFGP